MDALPLDMPCVMFALRRETLYVRDGRLPLARSAGAPCPAFVRHAPSTHLVLETGIGHAAVTAALDWLVRSPRRPRFVLYAGFAGALDAGFGVGDVLLVDEVVDGASGRWPTAWPFDGSALRRGRLLTADVPIASPAAKRRHGAVHQAHAVDMEAAHVAARCARHGLPFHCVRAISDAVDTPLSTALIQLMSAGEVSPGRAVRAMLCRPALAAEFWRLARDTRLAARRLAAALAALLASLSTSHMDAGPQLKMSRTTSPATSVSRKSRPWKR